MHYSLSLFGLFALQAVALPASPALPPKPELLPFATLTDCETSPLGSALRCHSDNPNLDGQIIAASQDGELPIVFRKTFTVKKRSPVPRECNGAIVLDTGACLHVGDGWDAYYTQVLINEALKATGNPGFDPVSPADPEFHA